MPIDAAILTGKALAAAAQSRVAQAEAAVEDAKADVQVHPRSTLKTDAAAIQQITNA